MKSLQTISRRVHLLCLLTAASSLVACGDENAVPEPRDTGTADATGVDTSVDDPDTLDASDDSGTPDVAEDTNPDTDEGGAPAIWQDPDDDNIPSGFDNCPELINPGQADIDLDGVGDGCDNCERAYNPEQTDSNSNGVGDACELQTCESGLFCDAGDGSEPACCQIGQECLAGACVDLCDAGIRCDGACCNDDELCVSATCVPLGPDCQNDGDCDYTEFCDAEVGRCLSFPDELSCQRPGDFDLFAPVEQWAWTGVDVDGVWYGNVIAVPTVADVDDDGLPEVVVAAYADSLATGVLVVLAGEDGETQYVNSGFPVMAARHLALANYDDDRAIEIAVTTNGALGVLDDLAACSTPSEANNFCYRWRVEGPNFDGVNAGTALAAHDFDGDGRVEILSGNAIYDARNGDVLLAASTSLSSGRGVFQTQMPLVADINMDGRLDLLTGNCAVTPDLVAGTTSTLWCADEFADGFPGVADLIDADGEPEVVVVRSGTLWVLDGLTGDVLDSFDLPGEGHGGAPNIADFDGDGRPEIATANAGCYTVFDLDCRGASSGDSPGCTRPVFESCTAGVDCDEVQACPALVGGTGDGILWSVATQDVSSSQTGSSVFDFQGDGRAEVLYNDECRFLAYDGATGRPYLQLYNTSRTASEYPVVVDVDGDLRSEIVFVANNDEFARDCIATIARRPDLFPDCQLDASEQPAFCTGGSQGVRVLRDPSDSWVRTRRIWNQHAYAITNVNDDGSIPPNETLSWQSFNTYRGNRQGQALLSAPDVVVASVVADNSTCPFSQSLVVRLANQGDLTAPPGVVVQVFAPDGELLAQETSAVPVPPGGTTDVVLQRSGPMAIVNRFRFAVVPSSFSEGSLECNSENNGFEFSVPCECQPEECDAIDNNCDSIVDNFGCLGCGLIGETCATDADCCKGVCTSGVCSVPCRPVGVVCRAGAECCDGICDIPAGETSGICLSP
jgi:hypothetical protein